eukprot:365990-Chlamydomonas_euryale.AAC.5
MHPRRADRDSSSAGCQHALEAGVHERSPNLQLPVRGLWAAYQACASACAPTRDSRTAMRTRQAASSSSRRVSCLAKDRMLPWPVSSRPCALVPTIQT